MCDNAGGTIRASNEMLYKKYEDYKNQEKCTDCVNSVDLSPTLNIGLEVCSTDDKC
jgi:hypothetical protein